MVCDSCALFSFLTPFSKTTNESVPCCNDCTRLLVTTSSSLHYRLSTSATREQTAWEPSQDLSLSAAMAHSLQSHQPTTAEIIDLAALEGHDADIPSNIGSIHHTPSGPSTRPHTPLYEKGVKSSALERDTEKGASPASTSIAGEPDEEAEQDPNIVDFDGPDDPQNPMNWKFSKKWGMVLLISAITFLTPLASSIFAPGVPEVMRDFKSTNDMLEGFMVSVYVLGFSFGPLSM